MLDPRWTLISDETRYSVLLREHFPEEDIPEDDRRIDFLCVSEGHHLVTVEIKRPASRISDKELDQVQDYVLFMRDLIERTTDPSMRHNEVTGYLLCGTTVNTGTVLQKTKSLERDHIYVRRYSDLLGMVRASHREFLERYEQLQAAKDRAG